MIITQGLIFYLLRNLLMQHMRINAADIPAQILIIITAETLIIMVRCFNIMRELLNNQ